MGGHRHDGNSPLPLGMDVSPAPTRWTGASTIWPHDPRTGWSYCVMIPSWISLPDPKSKASNSGSQGGNSSTAVFFKVLVGIQSPEGVSTLHGILRRFSDFIKLNDALKRAFPGKKLPAPPKKSLRHINNNKHHLQQRRLALSEWMVKLLGDIDVSRSLQIASFLELDDAARAAMPDTDKRELQLWLKKGIDKEIQMQISENEVLDSEDNVTTTDRNSIHDGLTEESVLSNAFPSGKPIPWLDRIHSIDSDAASELSFTSGSEFSVPPSVEARDHVSEPVPTLDPEILKAVQALLPIDQRGNVRRALANLHRRATTARADMEDLIARLNQETTVKDFLSAKVKDLEAELNMVKQKSIENLQHAVTLEREGYMNLQWELEECRVALAKALKESRLAEESKVRTEEQLRTAELENRKLKKELSEMAEKLQLIETEKDTIRAKALTETKVLVKEIKTLRKLQPELKQKLEAALKANSDLEAQLKHELNKKESRVKTLREVATLRERLQQCTVDFLAKEDAKEGNNNAAVADAADLLATSDSRIGLLIAEAQLLAEEDDDDDNESTGEEAKSKTDFENHSGSTGNGETMRKTLTDIFIDNAHLHKLVNSLTLKTLFGDSKEDKVVTNEVTTKKSMLYRFL